MVRLFLKVYGVLIATLVVSFVLQGQVMEFIWRELGSQYDYRVRFRPTYQLIDEVLAPVPQPQRAQRFAELARGFGMPARMTALESLPERDRLTREQAANLESGAMAALEHETGGFTVLRRLRGGEVVALDVPGPQTRKVKLITYAANWLVEFTMVAVLVWFWVRPFWRDLLSLRRGAEAIGAGRLDTRVATGRHSAMRQLGDAFNAMAAQVAALLQSHRTLTSAVSHELRTPIARLRFSHALARDEASAAGKDRLLARMEGDIATIDALTSELLDYARLERGAPALALQTVPAEAWIEDVVAEVRGDPDAAVPIAAQVAVAQVRCEPRAMSRAVINLLRNARRHARSTVRVTVRQDEARTVIDIDDDGPGIPAEARERLFEPFTRLDGSRDRDSGGFGLGLAIVRQVARWHGGDARIGDSPLGGARVSIAW